MLLCTLRGSSVLNVVLTSSSDAQGRSDAFLSCAATQWTEMVNTTAPQFELETQDCVKLLSNHANTIF